MSTNVIRQIVSDGEYGTQTIRMTVLASERGPQGEQGEPGTAATINAGNAYSVNPDASPAVINTGTTSNAVFDFYIPKGEKGDQGEPGLVQYTAGRGIRIKNNVISATGGGGGGDGVWGEITGDIADQTDLQTEFGKYTKTSDLATVATSGSYNDLTDKPTIPAAQVQSDWTQADNTKVDYIKNKPTIPTVNNSTITFTNNGTTVDSFTTNASSNKTIALTAPVITVTNSDPGEGASLATNHFVAVYGATPLNMDYSTSEADTGATWIDGSAIYKKTISTGALPNNTVSQTAHGISNLNRVIKVEGYAYHSSNQVTMPLPFVALTTSSNVAVDISGANIEITTGTDRTSYTESYVTLYYTKSS